VYALMGSVPLLRVVTTATGGAAIVGRVKSASRSPGRIEAEVEADQPATLIVGEGWSPGWRATIDGRSVDVRLAQGSRTAVEVPRGSSRVLMRFRPPWLVPALATSVLGLAVTLGLLWPGRRRRRPFVV
jgi:uncharacterized membrane protein YfhO